MTEFKVGDKVRTNHGEGVVEFYMCNACYPWFVRTNHNGLLWRQRSCDLTLIKPAWTPQPGELIEVRDSFGKWYKRFFFAFDGGHVVCRSTPHEAFFHRYVHGYRQIKKTVQVEIEGVKTEISRESAQALKKALVELEV